MTNINRGLAVYIHWPFCLSKCPYCDFYSEVKSADQNKIIDEYIEDLNFYHDLTSDRNVTSIFFGGGTPSLIEPKNIEKIINHIRKTWSMDKDIEISLEANPNTHNSTLFKDLKSAGINRLSLGVQALNDNDLRFLGRTHSREEAQKAIDDVLSTFDNHSMDLIYARPNQSLKSWQEELQETAQLGFKHLSLYQLTIEESTPFYNKGVEALDDDKALELYNFTEEFLSQHGYNKYEVSNFSQPTFESKHNLAYWQGKDYLGIGKTAHGRIGLIATTHRRQLEELTPQERAVELVLMGMRIKDGINKSNFKEQCGLDFDSFANVEKLKTMQQEGLIENTPQNIKATSKGFLVLNKIIEEII